MASLEGLAAFTLFRGDPTQLIQWCNHHLGSGIDHLYVGLDRPEPELVAALPADPRVSWQVYDDEQWAIAYPGVTSNVERRQVDAFHRAARVAAGEGRQYLAFVDTDELIVLDTPFQEIAAGLPDARVLQLSVREMWFAAGTAPEDQPFAATLAVGAPRRRTRIDWTTAFGWRAQFLRNGYLGHQAGKSIYRLPVVAGDLSVHGPRRRPAAADTVMIPSDQGRLLHYDAGCLRTWNAKWGSRVVGSVLATGLGPHRRAQEMLFRHPLRMDAAGQADFFDSFYSISAEAQALLAAGGALEEVDLGDLLDGPLDVPSPTPAPLIRLPDDRRRVDFQFALVGDQRFVSPTFATMAAVIAELGDKGSIRFVVLGDGLAAEDVQHLRSLETVDFDVEVVVHDITSDLDRDVGTEDAKRATFGRIYLVDHLPPQRTIYLDGDVLPTRDFSELFSLDLGGACLAGVSDSAAHRLVANPASVPIEQRTRLLGITRGEPLEYLNGGVLIFDLDNPDFRELALEARALVVLQGRALKQRDQDAMNLAFAGRKHRLPSGYNYMTQFFVSDRCLDGDMPQLKYGNADAALIHFSGKIKPWENPEDEFYNGIYRRIVNAAEAKLGVSCGFYFSRPTPTLPASWTQERWLDAISSEVAFAPAREAADEIALLDVADDGLYLTVSPRMYAVARDHDLRLTGLVGEELAFSVPLVEVGPVQTHLTNRIGPGVRKLAVDLVAAFGPWGGVARDLRLVLAAPGTDVSAGSTDLVRHVGGSAMVAVGAAATTAALVELGIRGRAIDVVDGWLRGVASSVSGKRESVSLYVDGQLVALSSADAPAPSDPENATRFLFRLARLHHLGYRGPVELRITGTNLPLPGSGLQVSDPHGTFTFDQAVGRWTGAPVARPSTLGRVRRRLRRND